MKTGRNDPCPCGSGKKYKKCCIEKKIIAFPGAVDTKKGSSSAEPVDSMEYMGKKNMASHTLGDIKTFLDGQKIESEEHLNQLTQSFMNNHNNSPLEEFLGLTPQQMMKLQTQKFTGRNDLVAFGNPRINRKAIPILNSILSLIEKTALVGAFPATVKGNMGLKFAQEAFEEIYLIDGFSKLRSEEDYIPLLKDRFLLEATGCLIHEGRNFQITRKGMDLAFSDNYDEFYKELLLAYMGEWNWSYNNPFDDLDILQINALFFLYILHIEGSSGLESSRFFSLFRQAFPGFYEDIFPGLDEVYEENIREYIKILFHYKILEEFLNNWGLVDLEYLHDDDIECIIRPTVLFSSLFEW
jgi:hypothetical protein